MGCLVMLAGLVAPRIVIVVLWFFSSWFANVSDNIFIPILGFIFLPYSFLWYSAVLNWYGGEWGFLQIAVMIIAVLMDLGATREGISRK